MANRTNFKLEYNICAICSEALESSQELEKSVCEECDAD